MAKKRTRQQNPEPFLADENAATLISSGTSSKILKEALIQQKEINEENEGRNPNNLVFAEDAATEVVLEEDDIDDFGGFSETQSQFGGYEEEVDEEDEKLLEAFVSKDAGRQQTLADLIVAKIKQKDEQVSSEVRPLPKLDESVIDLYKGVGKLLNKYTAGKIPKAFKHISSMQLWEEVLYLTEPEKWSPNAMYQATRIFASNLGVKKAERFYRLVLLPRTRDDIRKNKRLHFALYQALKKSIYKPAAFNKGILFPLCESGTCNLREAVIIGSIIQKVSIPPLHSRYSYFALGLDLSFQVELWNNNVALLRLAEMEYCGTTRMNQFMVESPLQVLLIGAGLASKGISFESHHASYYSGQILSEDRIVNNFELTGFFLLDIGCRILQLDTRTRNSYTWSLNPSAMLDLEGGSAYFGASVFSYAELEQATGDFDPSKELGDGGKLLDRREVAVKRLYEHNFKRVKLFMNEVEILTRLSHPNLVILYGCTSRHSRELLLVYEYIPNGTLADHLHGDRAKEGSLAWPIRMNIAIETARALAYLHRSDVIHRDVKTDNILLDNDFCVKVGDFGLSRLFPNHATHVSTAPQGTPGYVDPEYHRCYQLTDKSDVYSFGVVLVELISSLPAVDINRNRDDINLANLAVNRIQNRLIHELIDPSLGYESDPSIERMTLSVAEVAFRCLQLDKDMRPTMEEILEALIEIQAYIDENAGKIVDYGSALTTRRPPTSPDGEDDVLLKNSTAPVSPASVTNRWVSTSTTPTSSE
ncbi:hypothetical protein RHGRI_026861 [Rhododendron griersonianum]|uniref:Protein kinase domain-containing protein n=1 Tax=Rhododendron griersonianum TaxID=479676 RepID=A0AAV6J0S5_9ERIC|nr:hypothetical protein RHGRI_026861 [Rhododendron griersonianum]